MPSSREVHAIGSNEEISAKVQGLLGSMWSVGTVECALSINAVIGPGGLIGPKYV